MKKLALILLFAYGLKADVMCDMDNAQFEYLEKIVSVEIDSGYADREMMKFYTVISKSSVKS